MCTMIKSFADKRTQELCSKGKSKKFPADVAPRAARKLEYVNLAEICFRFEDGDAYEVEVCDYH